MTVQEWFNKGCNYQSGVLLFAEIGKNKNLVRRFQASDTLWNREKLKYELSKFLNTPAEKPATKKLKSQPTPQIQQKKSPTEKQLKSKPISFYPVSLHSVYQRRVETFYQAVSLKIQLNNLQEDNATTALQIQFQIWALIKENDKCWKILSHYDDTGRILSSESDSNFSKLSAQELVNQRQRFYVNKSKRLKTLANKDKELKAEINPAKRIKLENFILRKKEELQKIENDIDKLTQLING